MMKTKKTKPFLLCLICILLVGILAVLHISPFQVPVVNATILMVLNQSISNNGVTLYTAWPSSTSYVAGVAQNETVTWDSALYIIEVSFYLRSLSGATNNVTADIRQGCTGSGTGTVIATSITKLNASSISTSNTWYNFTFNPQNLTNGEVYAFVIRDAGEGGTVNVLVNHQGSNVDSNGIFITQSYSCWNSYATSDLRIIVYATDSAVLSSDIEASTTRAGAAVTLSANLTNALKYTWSWNNTGAVVNGTETTFTTNPTTFSGIWNTAAGSTVHITLYAQDSNGDWWAIKESWIVLSGIMSGTESTAALVNNSYAIRWQQKSFYAAARYWIFYLDSAINPNAFTPGIPCLISSTNNLVWSSPLVIFNDTTLFESVGENIQVQYNGSGHADFFIRANPSENVYYRSGIPQIDGSMTWLDSWVAIGNLTSGYDFYATFDSQGYDWVSWGGPAAWAGAGDHHVLLTKNAWTNGSWSTAPGFPILVSDSSNQYTNNFIIPLLNGTIYTMYYFSTAAGGSAMKGRLWNGIALETEETAASNSPHLDYAQGNESYARAAVSDLTGNIYLLFTNQSSKIVFYIRNSAGSWSSPTVVASAVSSYSSPSLCLYFNVIVASWIQNLEAIDVRYYLITSSSWSAVSQLVYAEYPFPTFNYGGYSGRLNSFTQFFGMDLGVIWMENGTDPATYSLHFGLFNAPYITPTIGDFYAPSTYPNISFLLNATVSYPGGNTYFCNTTVTIGDVTLLWINVTDSFSEYADPNNYCTLTSGSSVMINLTSIRLSWNVTFAWDWPEGVKSPSGVVWVFSDSYKSATNSATDLFTFTWALSIQRGLYSNPISPVVTSSFNLVGVIYYDGSTVAPSTGSVTVYAARDSTVAGSTTSIGSDGTFQIGVMAPGAAGTYVWTVYAGANSVQNQSINVYVHGTTPAGPVGPAPTPPSTILFYGSRVSLGSIARGRTINFQITVTWTGATQMQINNVSVAGPNWTLPITMPQTFYQDLSGNGTGTAPISVTLTVPNFAPLTSQQITLIFNCQSGSALASVNCLVQFDVTLPPASSTPGYQVQTIIGIALATSLGVVLYSGTRRRKPV